MNAETRNATLIKSVQFPPRPMLVKLNESGFFEDTESGKSLLEKCGEIFGVYLYDEALVTYRCSSSADYWLTFLEYVTSNEIDEETERELQDSVSGDDYYVQAEIDSIPLSLDKKVVADAVTPYPDKETVGEYMERVFEYYQGNPVW